MTQLTETAATPTQSPSTLRLSDCLLYASPVMCTTLMMGSLAIVHSIYAKYFGIGLTTIASILLLARVFDAFTDPLMGFLSDRYRARTGSRKLFVVLGAITFVLSAFFLFIPGEFAPFKTIDFETTQLEPVSSLYFLVVLFLFYAAFTLFEIPHLAWASDIARTTDDKNRIFTLRSMAVSLGVLVFVLVPLLPMFDSNEITPQTLQWAFIFGAMLLLPLLYICIKRVTDGPQRQDVKPAPVGPKVSHSARVAEFLTLVFSNKPFLLFLLASSFTIIGISMMVSVMFFFIDGYLGLGNEFAVITAVSWAVSLATLWFWYKLFTSRGKKFSWILLLLLVSVALLAYTRLEPGNDNFLALMLMKSLVNMVCGAMWALIPAQLSHIVDYDTWKNGGERSATYYSLYNLVLKSSGALGGAAGLALAGWFGFDATSTSQSDSGVLGLHAALAYGPCVFFLLAMVFVFLNPINETRHQSIRKRLDRREARAGFFKPDVKQNALGV
jgi:Na+/melibiose symporter-like transporter